MAAEKVTPEAINFMASYGRGLICLAMTGQRLDELELGPMAPHNTARSGTALIRTLDRKIWDDQAMFFHYGLALAVYWNALVTRRPPSILLVWRGYIHPE